MAGEEIHKVVRDERDLLKSQHDPEGVWTLMFPLCSVTGKENKPSEELLNLIKRDRKFEYEVMDTRADEDLYDLIKSHYTTMMQYLHPSNCRFTNLLTFLILHSEDEEEKAAY